MLTVLPGTVRREVAPVVGGRARLVYSPLFIAMGTVMYDFLNPEFVLMGADDQESLLKVAGFYDRFYERSRTETGRIKATPIRIRPIESAELPKVAYNADLPSTSVL